MSPVKEKVPLGTRPSSVELDDDGIVVRFAYHGPRKRFCDPVRLIDFVEEYENGGDKSFVSGDYRILMLRGNRVKLTFFPPIFGHKEMVLPKDQFTEMIKAFFKK